MTDKEMRRKIREIYTLWKQLEEATAKLKQEQGKKDKK